MKWVRAALAERSEGVGVVADSNDNCYVAFNAWGPVNFGNGVVPACREGSGGITKLNPSGAVEWVRMIQAAGSSGVRAIAIDQEGSVFVTGWVYAGRPGAAFQPGVLVAKYDSTGREV
jgi:hypothetical protein